MPLFLSPQWKTFQVPNDQLNHAEQNQAAAWVRRSRWPLILGAAGIVLLVPVFLALTILIPFLSERRVAQQVLSAGGTVSYEYFGPQWLPPAMRTQYPLYDRVTVVNLHRSKHVDRILLSLGLLKELETLDLELSDVSDNGLKALGKLTQLRGLGLNHTRISDAGLSHLQSMTGLQGLHLDGTSVTDEGVRHLQSLSHLQLLKLSNTSVSDAGIDVFFKMQELQILNLAASRVTRRGFTSLRKALPDCELPIQFDMHFQQSIF